MSYDSNSCLLPTVTSVSGSFTSLGLIVFITSILTTSHSSTYVSTTSSITNLLSYTSPSNTWCVPLLLNDIILPTLTT